MAGGIVEALICGLEAPRLPDLGAYPKLVTDYALLTTFLAAPTEEIALLLLMLSIFVLF